MTPYAYTITTSRRSIYVRPTIESAVAYLIETECPVETALDDKPITALFPDLTEERIDLTPYTEECEPAPEKVAEIEKLVDEAIADSEKRWAEVQRRLKPGEKHRGFSGECWYFKKDREDLIRLNLRKWRVRWKTT